MVRKQISLTLDDIYIQSLKEIADQHYEGNISQACRAFFDTYHLVKFKPMLKFPFPQIEH